MTTFAEWLVELSESNADLTTQERVDLTVIADDLEAKDKRIAELEAQLSAAQGAASFHEQRVEYFEPRCDALAELVREACRLVTDERIAPDSIALAWLSRARAALGEGK